MDETGGHERKLGRPTLSVVIPCRNDGRLLERALASLHAQETTAEEILVVNNGSSDNTTAVARAWGVKVVDEPRPGITWATRTGFDHAQGQLMLRTDADILAAPDFLSRLHRAWERAAESEKAGGRRVVAVTGAARFELPAPWGEWVGEAYVGAYRASVGSALGHNPLFGTNYCVRASWWQRVRAKVDSADTFVHEDMQLSFHVGDEETVWFQPDLRLDTDPRPLYGAGQILRRFRRGWYSMRRGFELDPPHRRLVRRRAHAAAMSLVSEKAG